MTNLTTGQLDAITNLATWCFEFKAENEALTAQIAKLTERIAELEAENTPPKGCDASWKRANVWVAPLDERGLHEVRYANGTTSDVGPVYVKGALDVTFP